MQQAIIWTNADPIHWHIYAELGENELKWNQHRSFGNIIFIFDFWGL